jgi:hypothetical protein
MYIDIHRHLSNAVRRKCSEKGRTNSWVLLPDNAPAHRSVLVKDFSTKIDLTLLENPPYSTDVSAADLYLIHRLKSAFKGQRFCDATDVIKNATEELKMFSQNDYQEGFQHIFSRWKKCAIAQGDSLKEL